MFEELSATCLTIFENIVGIAYIQHTRFIGKKHYRTFLNMEQYSRRHSCLSFCHVYSMDIHSTFNGKYKRLEAEKAQL